MRKIQYSYTKQIFCLAAVNTVLYAHEWFTKFCFLKKKAHPKSRISQKILFLIRNLHQLLLQAADFFHDSIKIN